MRIYLMAAAMVGVVVVMNDGHVQVFTEQDALARVAEPAFAQALGNPLPERAKTYLEITQMRQGNTTTDAAIERAELGR
jgi:hypothetical protein